MNYTYFIQEEHGGPVKVGRSNRPNFRIKTLQTGNPRQLVPLLILAGVGADLETYLHRRFSHRKVRDEWFDLTETDIGEIAAFFFDAVIPLEDAIDEEPAQTPTLLDKAKPDRIAKFREDFETKPELFEGLTVREIAEQYGVSTGTVSNARTGK